MGVSKKDYSVEKSRAFVETFTIDPHASGPLDGLRFAVKDLIDVAGRKTSCGNPTWRDTHPAAVANAVCVDQLLCAGATCAGKTITDELAFGLNGENHFYGTPLNPRAPNRVPGGSSSGSASAVACGVVDFALGTDTGGSVRVPAANCGLFGIRPSHGVVSVAGVMPFAPTFDTVGVLAGSIGVLAKAASVLLACEASSECDVETVYVLEDVFALCDESVKTALEKPVREIKAVFGGKVRSTTLDELLGADQGVVLQAFFETHYRLLWAEVWSSLGSWVEEAEPEFGPRTRMNFVLAKGLERSRIAEIVIKREELFRRMRQRLGTRDLLLIPTIPAVAPLKNSLENDRTKGDYYPRTIRMASIAAIGRLPQITMPLADVDGIPAGLSLLASHGMDDLLLAAAKKVAPESDNGRE